MSRVKGYFFLKHPTDPIQACAAVQLQGCGRNELHVSHTYQVAESRLGWSQKRVESCNVRWNPDFAQNCNQTSPHFPLRPLEVELNVRFTFERTTPRPCELPPTSADSVEHSLLTVGIIATAAVVICMCAIALVCCARRYLGKTLPKSGTSSARERSTDKEDPVTIVGHCRQDAA
mmetsp:Transcript_75781/g.149810  ORF Transcript_75781/g.149810 Transcript_75781/m.149810 type:complete len:175 (-) Transcript_75781:294-818(-)